MSELKRLTDRLEEFKAQGRMPAGFRIPAFLQARLSERVAAGVNAILDKHLETEAAHAGTGVRKQDD